MTFDDYRATLTGTHQAVLDRMATAIDNQHIMSEGFGMASCSCRGWMLASPDRLALINDHDLHMKSVFDKYTEDVIL